MTSRSGNAWNSATASLDAVKWDNAAYNLRNRARKFITDVSENLYSTDTRRVPNTTERTPAFYIASSLLTSSLVRSQLQLPQATTALLAAQTVVFFLPNGVLLRDVSLAPFRVIKKSEYRRLFISAFVHADLTHLLLNSTSIIEAGQTLETCMGPLPYLIEVGIITTMTHGLYVIGAWLEKRLLKLTQTYYSHSIGFSGVSFALGVISGYVRDSVTARTNSVQPPHYDGHNHNDHESSNLFVQPSYQFWIHLAVTAYLFPASNLLGHLTGILAGLIRVYLPAPFIWIRRKTVNLLRRISRVAFDNRIDDERRLECVRSREHLITQSLLFVASMAMYIARQKQSKSS